MYRGLVGVPALAYNISWMPFWPGLEQEGSGVYRARWQCDAPSSAVSESLARRLAWWSRSRALHRRWRRLGPDFSLRVSLVLSSRCSPLAATLFDGPLHSSHLIKKADPPSRLATGADRHHAWTCLNPLASCGPRKDWDDVTGYTVDMTISGFVPSHHEPSEALVRIVDKIHQPLHFP